MNNTEIIPGLGSGVENRKSEQGDRRLWHIMGASVVSVAVTLATTSFAASAPRGSEYSRSLAPCREIREEVAVLDQEVQVHVGEEPPTFSDLNNEWDTITLSEGTEITIKGIGRGAEVLNRGAANAQQADNLASNEGIRNTSRMWYEVEVNDDSIEWNEERTLQLAGVYIPGLDNDEVCFDEYERAK